MKLITVAIAATLVGCGTAKIASKRETAGLPHEKPKTIYVADFEIDAAEVKTSEGMIALPKAPGPLAEMLPPLPGAKKEPEVVARDVSKTLSAALVKELAKAGLDARRLYQTTHAPDSGWLVSGKFTEVNEGNPLQRSMIGFGAGKTEVQLVVRLNDLAQGKPASFYELNTTADSGKAPGAAPTIVLGPAGAVARFVIAGQDLNRNLKQTAAKISEEIVLNVNRCETKTL